MKPKKRFDDSDFESLLARIADDYSEQLANGQEPNIESYARRHPAIADAIRRVLPALSALDDSWVTPYHSSSKQDAFVTHEVLGDFRIVREIGRGGMGIVYEAEECSLSRSVALKVLPFTAMLDEKQLARFKNEARAAATLSHRNIVPVYSFGSQGGIHFYSMKFVRGQSMAELIQELRTAKDGSEPSPHSIARTLITSTDAAGALAHGNPNDVDEAVDPGGAHGTANNGLTQREKPNRNSPGGNAAILFQNVARLGVQAACAIDHAHAHGVLHRDIKPANIMIDQDLQLWITDFGLARLGGDAGLTMTGDVLGTARYMSPEQVLEKRVVIDHRDDVYSLGITLYELATLKVAFDGEDRFALWRQIAIENPTAPRKVNHRIPADLETIIVKAIEKNPVDRYQTAGELAEDLQSFLDNKPIRAKSPTLIGRASKWAQRHQSFVWAAMALMATIIAVLGTSVLFINSAYQAVHAQRERAETHLQLARDVIDDTYINEIQRLRNAPGMTRRQRESLLRLMKFYEQLPQEELNNNSLYHDFVKARLRLGDIHSILGQYQESISAFQNAVDAAQSLCDRNPEPMYQASLVLAHVGLGKAQLAIQERQRAISSHRSANDRIDQLMDDHPDDLTVQRLAAEKIYLPIALEQTSVRAETFRVVITELDRLTKRFPTEEVFPKAMVKAQDAFGVLLQSIGSISEAEAIFRAAVGTQKSLCRTHPEDPSFTFQHATVLSHLAMLLEQKGELALALKTNQTSFELLDKLVSEYPHRVQYQATLAQLRNDLGALHVAELNRSHDADENRIRIKLEQAAAEFENAIAMLEPLAESDPDTPAYRFKLASNLINLGAVTARVDPVRSQKCKQRAMTLSRSLAQQYPDDAQYQRNVAAAFASSASTLDQPGRIAAFRNATDIMQAVADRFPERIDYTERLIRYKSLLVSELTKAKRGHDAEVEFDDVMRLTESFSERYPESAREDDLAIRSANRAEFSWRMGKVKETISARQIAIHRYQLLLDHDPENATYKSELCSQLKRLAYAHVSLGQLPEALERCLESITLNEQLHHEFPALRKYRQKLVRRYDLLALIHLRACDYEQAEAGLRKKLETVQELAKESPSENTTKLIAEIHIHLANIIDESDAERSNDALFELEQANAAAKNADNEFLAMLTNIQHAMLLNDRHEPILAQSKCLDALRTVDNFERHLASREIHEHAAVIGVRWQIAAELARAGESEHSSRILKQITEKSNAHSELRNLHIRGIANWLDADPDCLQNALSLSKLSVEEDPDDGRHWLYRGCLLVRAADHESAIECLHQAGKLNASSVWTGLLLTIAYANSGNKTAAIQNYDRVKGDVVFGDVFRLFETRRLRDEAKAALDNIGELRDARS